MSDDGAARLAKCVEGFLDAVRHRRTTRAARLLRRYPEITRADLYVACSAGDAEAAAALLDEDAALRSAPHTAGEGFTPLLYACASPLHAESRPQLVADPAGDVRGVAPVGDEDLAHGSAVDQTLPPPKPA